MNTRQPIEPVPGQYEHDMATPDEGSLGDLCRNIETLDVFDPVTWEATDVRDVEVVVEEGVEDGQIVMDCTISLKVPSTEDTATGAAIDLLNALDAYRHAALALLEEGES